MSAATPWAPAEAAPQATEEARDGRPGDTDTSEEAQAKLIERPAPEQVLRCSKPCSSSPTQPVEVAVLARSINAPKDEVVRALDALAEQCRERGVRLQRTGELVQLVSAPETAAYVERFLGMELPRLTDASLRRWRSSLTASRLPAPVSKQCVASIATARSARCSPAS